MNHNNKLRVSDRNHFVLYDDEKLTIIQEGEEISWKMYLEPIIWVFIFILFFFNILPFEQLLNGYLEESELLSFILIIMVALFFLLVIAFQLSEILKLRAITKDKQSNQDVYISLLTEEPINKNSSVFYLEIGSHKVYIPLDREHVRKGYYVSYNSVALIHRKEEPEIPHSERQKKWNEIVVDKYSRSVQTFRGMMLPSFEHGGFPKFLLPMEENLQLEFSNNTINFSLSYTDPENPKVFQKPRELLILLKELSLLEGALVKMKKR